MVRAHTERSIAMKVHECSFLRGYLGNEDLTTVQGLTLLFIIVTVGLIQAKKNLLLFLLACFNLFILTYHFF